MATARTLKISLSETVYRAARDLAAELGVSLEQLAREAIASRAAKPTERNLTEAYELLADDAAEADTEVFLEAQTEALLNG